MEMKMDFTLFPHIPPMVNEMRSTKVPVLPKASPVKKFKWKKLRNPEKAFRVPFLRMKQSS